MFTRILVPLDGSPAAEKALPIAARLALTAQGTLVLIRVITMGTHFNGKSILTSEALQSLVETEKQKALDYLINIATSPILNDIEVEMDVSWGQVAPSVFEQVKNHQCDLILLSRKHHKGLKHLLPGSVAERVVMYAPVPVFLIHENGPLPIFPYIALGQPTCVLMGIDDIAQTSPVIKSASALLAGLEAGAQPTIRLARVISPYTAAHQQGPQASMLDIMNVVKEHQLKHVQEFQDIDENSMEIISSACMSESTLIGTDYANALIKEAETNIPENGDQNEAHFHLLAISSDFGKNQQAPHLGNTTLERITHETQLPVLVVPALPTAHIPPTAQAIETQILETL
ncbi:universal stress protein [Dictyobacter kobayashii]|uniref:UspA domain-containing protein n=1 Tax=Dictyobacter kobayashii TaxID=2014872 RepID=A0A402AN37_9CHLR|nr:universal stress protein [Dictyobacter kobayashii]GCE20557.1 hypothetical protein KDK_43570 [Dictyobacter kobayashii]